MPPADSFKNPAVHKLFNDLRVAGCNEQTLLMTYKYLLSESAIDNPTPEQIRIADERARTFAIKASKQCFADTINVDFENKGSVDQKLKGKSNLLAQMVKLVDASTPCPSIDETSKQPASISKASVGNSNSLDDTSKHLVYCLIGLVKKATELGEITKDEKFKEAWTREVRSRDSTLQVSELVSFPAQFLTRMKILTDDIADLLIKWKFNEPGRKQISSELQMKATEFVEKDTYYRKRLATLIESLEKQALRDAVPAQHKGLIDLYRENLLGVTAAWVSSTGSLADARPFIRALANNPSAADDLEIDPVLEIYYYGARV